MLENMCYFPLLVLKGIYHYRKYIFAKGLNQMEGEGRVCVCVCVCVCVSESVAKDMPKTPRTVQKEALGGVLVCVCGFFEGTAFQVSLKENQKKRRHLGGGSRNPLILTLPTMFTRACVKNSTFDKEHSEEDAQKETQVNNCFQDRS